MNELDKRAKLFNVQLPEYKQLRACKRELEMLKTLWDVIELVKYQFSAWATTKWTDVNVEEMDQVRETQRRTRAGITRRVCSIDGALC